LFLGNESCSANTNIIAVQGRVAEECCSIPLQKQQHETKQCSQLIGFKNCHVTI